MVAERSWFAALTVAVACATPAPSVPPGGGADKGVDAASPRDAAIVEAAATERPFTVGPPIHFRIERGRAKTTRFPVASSAGATVAPDGVTYVVDVIEPKRSGALLVSPTIPQGVLFATPEVHDVRFSPSGRRVLVLDDETRAVTVLSVPDGRELSTVRPAWLARFVDDETVPFWDGCKLQVLAPTTGRVRTIAEPGCGAADASDDGRVFVIATPSRTGVVLERTPYQALVRIDVPTGKVSAIARAGDRDLQSLRLSPVGDVVCLYDGRSRCVSTSDGHAIPLPAGADVFGMVFSLDGRRVVFPEGKSLAVADFDSRVVRSLDLGSPDLRYWHFLPGGKRIVTYQAGAWACDLVSEVCEEIYPRTMEPGGFTVVPGTDRRFVLGLESGATRGFSFVELPN